MFNLFLPLIYYTLGERINNGIFPYYTLQAQAIMLLAGHGSSPAYNKQPSTAQLQTPFPSPSTGDGFFGNQSISGLASPSVTSHATSRPRGAFSSSNSLTVSKPVATSVSSINQSEPSNVAAQFVMTNLIPAGSFLNFP